MTKFKEIDNLVLHLNILNNTEEHPNNDILSSLIKIVDIQQNLINIINDVSESYFNTLIKIN